MRRRKTTQTTTASAFAARGRLPLGGCSSMAEREPSKLDMRVRFPSPAPRFAGGGVGFQRARPCGSVVEHSLGKGEVASSILAMGTIGGALRYITTLLVCVASLCNAARCVWIPAFAGMTGIVKSGARLMAVVALLFVIALTTNANAKGGEWKEYGIVCHHPISGVWVYLPDGERELAKHREFGGVMNPLVRGVNKMMEENWQPQGGISVIPSDNNCQSIVRNK